MISATAYCIWIATVALQLLLVAVCIRHRTERRHPIFTAYTYISTFQAVAMLFLAAAGWSVAYFWGYFACMFADRVLVIAICAKVYFRVFGPTKSLPAWIPNRAALIAGASLAIGLILAKLCVWLAAANGGAVTKYLVATEQVLASPVAFFLWGIILFAKRLHYDWPAKVAGLTAGLVLTSSVNTFTVYIRASGSAAASRFAGYLQVAAYLIATVVWLKTFWVKEEIPARATPEQRRQMFEMWAEVNK